MAFNPGQILQDMVSAAAGAAGQGWNNIRTSVTHELEVLAQRLAQIVRLRVSGEIDDEDARMFLQMAKNTFIAMVAMTTALTAIAVQRILDAALGVVRTAVNNAIGFALI